MNQNQIIEMFHIINRLAYPEIYAPDYDRASYEYGPTEAQIYFMKLSERAKKLLKAGDGDDTETDS